MLATKKITMGFLSLLIWGIGTPGRSSPTPYSGRAASYSKNERQTSQALTEKLRKELPSETGLSSGLESGIAILSGQVSTLARLEEAVDIATIFASVRAVAPNLSLSLPPAPLSKKVLKERVQEALSRSPSSSKYVEKILVENGGVVVLHGSAPSAGTRYLLAESAKDVPGVRRLINQIQITAKETRSQEQILQEMRALLKRDPWIAEERVEVLFKDDTLFLKGELGSADRAGRVVNHCGALSISKVDSSGLKTTSNSLSPLERNHVLASLPAAEIQESILQAFRRVPTLSAKPPIVGVASEVVTLSGTVESFEAKELAVMIAEHALGANRVIDKVTVTSNKPEARSR